MNIFISNKKLEHNKIEPFIHSFDNVYLSIDDDFEELNEFKLSEKNIKRIFDVINYSWDGTIYIFEKKDEQEVLKELSEWFLDSKNHTLSGENGIKNCLLLKHSQNHLVIVDTQRDDGTTFDLFMKSLEAKKPEIMSISFTDCHLIDNMYLGRDSNFNEFETLYLLYKEEIIDESFFLRGFEVMGESEEGDNYFNIVSKDKTIVITGKLAIEREELEGYLIDAEYNVSNKVSADTWLWCGEKTGKNKISNALEKKAVVNSIMEVIDMAYNQYIVNKNKKNSYKIK